jgi:hypothetical protein
MARAIPRASWSEAEIQRERSFHWLYLVNQWLVPGPSVFTERGHSPLPERWAGPSPQALLENGWLLEAATNCEQ